ncbi:MAG: MBOAT family O-acyltransferase [Vicinamibacterales bacterium]
MTFNSIGFLLAFPVFAAIYFVVPARAQTTLLLVASLAGYSAFDVRLAVVLVSVAGVVWAVARSAARRAGRQRAAITAVGVAAVLAVLVAGKYLGFLAASLDGATGVAGLGPVVPDLNWLGAAGVSFYVLSAVSYLVDVKRGTIAPERSFAHVAVYLAFFPKLLAGPIARVGPFLQQLARPRRFDEPRVVAGLQQMLWGFFKKVVIADRLALIVDRAYAQPAFTSPADLVIATYGFAVQLYCDFSGYSDIAIGASRVLGFDLVENFRRPFLASSVSSFWSQRWHISLGAWFRDYVYIPLGGSRVMLPWQAANIMAVFLLSGLWHGANWTFVVWGGLNGLLVVTGLAWRRSPLAAWPVVETLRRGVPSAVRPLITFHLILVTWVFFRAASIEDGRLIVGRVAGALGQLPSLLIARLQVGDLTLPILLVAALLAIEVVDERRPVWQRLGRVPVPVRWAAYYALAFALIVLGVWTNQQFVYMRF